MRRVVLVISFALLVGVAGCGDDACSGIDRTVPDEQTLEFTQAVVVVDEVRDRDGYSIRGIRHMTATVNITEVLVIDPAVPELGPGPLVVDDFDCAVPSELREVEEGRRYVVLLDRPVTTADVRAEWRASYLALIEGDDRLRFIGTDARDLNEALDRILAGSDLAPLDGFLAWMKASLG